MTKVTYTKQADGTVVQSEPLDDPTVTVASLKAKRDELQGQFDYFNRLVAQRLPVVQQQLSDLDEQIAALVPLVDVKPIDPPPPPPPDVPPADGSLDAGAVSILVES